MLIGALAFGEAMPAAAASAYGAIAIEVGTWAWGTWHDGTTSAEASSGALAECNKNSNGANDCILVVTFSEHTCAAVAHDQNGNYKFNYGNTSTEAIGAAVSLLGSGTAIASVCNASAAPPAFVPEPIHVSQSVVGNDTSPVYVYKSTLESEYDHTYQQCLSWRNLASKAVAAIKFDVHIYDDFNASLQSFTATTKEGEHDTPGVAIDNICWNGTLWTPAQIKAMRVEKVTVLSVRFDDDSVWTPGKGWTKTYSTSGVPLPAPQTIAGSAPLPTPASPYTPQVPVAAGGSAILFSNGTPLSLSYSVKCANEASYHTFTIASLASQSVDAANWGISCPSYNFLLATPPGPDGSSTTVEKTLSPGGPYQIVFNAQTGAYDVATAPAGVTIVNDVSENVTFSIGCPSGSASNYTLAAGQSQTYQTPCPGTTLTVSTGTDASSISKTFPLTSGRTYHLQFNNSTNLITLAAS